MLHHIDYSSDPEEARIHLELTSPSRCMRHRNRHLGPRRMRGRSSPENHGISHYHYYHGGINVRQPPWMAEHTRPSRTHIRSRQAPGGDDGSSPGDEEDSIPGRSSG